MSKTFMHEDFGGKTKKLKINQKEKLARQLLKVVCHENQYIVFWPRR